MKRTIPCQPGKLVSVSVLSFYAALEVRDVNFQDVSSNVTAILPSGSRLAGLLTLP